MSQSKEISVPYKDHKVVEYVWLEADGDQTVGWTVVPIVKCESDKMIHKFESSNILFDADTNEWETTKIQLTLCQCGQYDWHKYKRVYEEWMRIVNKENLT